MPRKKPEPKYKVGDVLVDLEHSSIGIVEEVSKPMYNNYFYYTQNFDGTGSAHFEKHFKLCEGVTDSILCDKCQYRFNCWTTRRKV